MLYFAYGSNLDWQEMRECCPSARFLCLAMLKDHKMTFPWKSTKRCCGVASVKTCQGQNVWGVIYEIDAKDIPRLDRKEGVNSGAYERKEREVYAVGDEQRPLTVAIYLAQPQDNPPKPNDAYKKLIVEGARFWRLPPDYVQRLESIETA